MNPLVAVCLGTFVALSAAAFLNHPAPPPTDHATVGAAAAAAPPPERTAERERPKVDVEKIESRIQTEIVDRIQKASIRWESFSRAMPRRSRKIEYEMDDYAPERAPKDDVMVFRVYERFEDRFSREREATRRQIAVGRYHVETEIFELAPASEAEPHDKAFKDLESGLRALGAIELTAEDGRPLPIRSQRK